ncbi:hypothetical protein VTJ49DRAFT_4200 [Mycothermus thermophilus]|uniref:Uncharacterized protein n=1 Tax=Humicola insolens TaxID=85995 RepID=A0ABR3V5W0_HUMIN
MAERNSQEETREACGSGEIENLAGHLLGQDMLREISGLPSNSSAFPRLVDNWERDLPIEPPPLVDIDGLPIDPPPLIDINDLPDNATMPAGPNNAGKANKDAPLDKTEFNKALLEKVAAATMMDKKKAEMPFPHDCAPRETGNLAKRLGNLEFKNKWGDHDLMDVIRDGSVGQKWNLIWDILRTDPLMRQDEVHWPNYQKMLNHAIESTRPPGKEGPICGNPDCRAYGHTLAVCPKPTNMEHADMAGCFFCNVVDHDADDCPMMDWADPPTLITYLIHNRAGLPPWCTRIDWVKLAIDNWDMVDFTKLPLTRACVKKHFIPHKGWEHYYTAGIIDPSANSTTPAHATDPSIPFAAPPSTSGTGSAICPIAGRPHFFTDPLFAAGADVFLLRKLAGVTKTPAADAIAPECIQPILRRNRDTGPPLMEASRELCYCQATNSTTPEQLAQSEHAVFRNPLLRKYIPDMRAPKEVVEQLRQMERSEKEELEQLVKKKLPKKADKEKKKGRRAMKKEREERERRELAEIIAQAARKDAEILRKRGSSSAAAAAGAAGGVDGTEMTTHEMFVQDFERWRKEKEPHDEECECEKCEEKRAEETPVSERLLQIAEEVSQMLENLKLTVKTCREEAEKKCKEIEERG